MHVDTKSASRFCPDPLLRLRIPGQLLLMTDCVAQRQHCGSRRSSSAQTYMSHASAPIGVLCAEQRYST